MGFLGRFKHHVGAVIRHVVSSGWEEAISPAEQEAISRVQTRIREFKEHDTFVRANEKALVKLLKHVETLGRAAEKSTMLLSEEWTRVKWSSLSDGCGTGAVPEVSVRQKPLMGLKIQLNHQKVALEVKYNK
jgi:hypothetical protein